MNIWILAIYLQILDFLTTIIFLSKGGEEGSPLVALFIKNLGVWGLILLKFLSILVILLIFLFCRKQAEKDKRKARIVISILNYIYAVVIIWNLIFILAI